MFLNSAVVMFSDTKLVFLLLHGFETLAVAWFQCFQILNKTIQLKRNVNCCIVLKKENSHPNVWN